MQKPFFFGGEGQEKRIRLGRRVDWFLQFPWVILGNKKPVSTIYLVSVGIVSCYAPHQRENNYLPSKNLWEERPRTYGWRHKSHKSNSQYCNWNFQFLTGKVFLRNACSQEG